MSMKMGERSNLPGTPRRFCNNGWSIAYVNQSQSIASLLILTAPKIHCVRSTILHTNSRLSAILPRCDRESSDKCRSCFKTISTLVIPLKFTRFTSADFRVKKPYQLAIIGGLTQKPGKVKFQNSTSFSSTSREWSNLNTSKRRKLDLR
jgi:hypothetical protein